MADVVVVVAVMATEMTTVTTVESTLEQVNLGVATVGRMVVVHTMEEIATTKQQATRMPPPSATVWEGVTAIVSLLLQPTIEA